MPDIAKSPDITPSPAVAAELLATHGAKKWGLGR
jgi:hypothetical protein